MTKRAPDSAASDPKSISVGSSPSIVGSDDEFATPGTGVPFPVVGVGASAGGVDAVTQLLRALPIDTGLSFVVIQHLAPDHPSNLAEILSRATTMAVDEVRDEPEVEPNHVYVIPPGRNMVIAGGKLILMPQDRYARRHGIDQFFASLAEDCGHKAIGVVLSGAMSDGTLGLEAIKAAGGITFAQNDTAQHDSMPRSAVASGCVDFVLPPNEIAALGIEDVLLDAGFAIAGVAFKLENGLALIESGACDAAIVDSNLAGVSADPAAIALTVRGLPFIVLSGYSQEQIKSPFVGARFLQKPCRPELLIQALTDVLPKQ